MSPTREHDERTMPEAAVWQDVEFGGYAADLPLWEELGEGSEAIVELGAGVGRVSLHLARRGTFVSALERDAELCEELRRRASGLPVAVTPIDLEQLQPGGKWVSIATNLSLRLAIAPLHLIQQVEPDARPGLLAAIAELLPAGGVLAAVIVDESSLLDGGIVSDQVPDMRDVGGWVYSSEPLWVQVDEHELKIRRLRKRVSPAGEVERTVHDELLHRLSPEALESEALAAGFSPAGRRSIESGPSEADSLVVLLESS